ncbi:MAG TPA: hypothetical protein VLA04_02070 [Verrucomicrobiae bacterium]|nr:hypothetical protein [Verrucomicrobiae bacterium]
MQNRSLKIFLTCTFSAIIGTFLALEFGPLYWWVGMLMGGSLAYALYEYEKIPLRLRAAWRAVSEAPFGQWLVTSLVGLVDTGKILLPILGWFALTGAPCAFLFMNTAPRRADNSELITIATVVSIMFSVIWMFCGAAARDHLKGQNGRTRFTQFLTAWEATAKSWIIIVPFLGPLWYLTLVIIFEGVEGAYDIICPVAAFCWTFFKLIHSEFALLCGCDTALGVVAGYVLGNIWWGGAIGGCIALINYELVSKRWLKLVPAQ